MKKEHLLMTMLLPAAFAACTSEEFEGLNNNNSLAERKEIGKVTFSFNNGVASRWGGDFLPEISDVTGAALIDNYIPGATVTKPENKWKEQYSIVDYIQTNYPFTYNGEYWASEANMVEGNYFFYAPYASTHQVRSAIKYQAPVKQTLTVAEGKIVENSALEAFAKDSKYPFYFSYQFLDAENDNTNISVAMRPVFSYPKFTLKNESGEDVVITRVLVEDLKGKIAESGEFSNQNVATKMHETKDDQWGGSLETNMKGNLYTTDLLVSDKTTYTNLVRADLTEAVTIASGESTTFSMVMPAMSFAAGDIKVYFVTESGKAYTYTNSTSSIKLVPGRRYPAQDYQVSGELKASAGQLLTKTIKKNESLVKAPYIVTSKAELIDAINNTPASSKKLTLTIAGDVEFDSEVLSTIAEVLSQTVEFVGDINIVGGKDKALDINQKVVFDNATIKSGKVKFNNDVVTFDKVTVNEGAELSVDKVAATGEKEIVNNGTLVLNNTVGAIENNSTLKLGKNGSYTSLTSAENKVQSVEISGDVTLKEGEIEGNWTVPTGSTLTLSKETTLKYGSSINVAGTLKGEKLTLKGEMILSGRTDAAVELDGTYTAATASEAEKFEYAKLILKKGATVMGAISGESTQTKDLVAQIVTIEDGVNFFDNSTAISNTKATYTVNGDVTKADELKVPAQANTLVITGNVAASDAISYTNKNITEVTINGNVIATNNAVTITTGAASVLIKGDILASKDVWFGGATELEVKGELNTSAKFMAGAATQLVFNKVTFKGSSNWVINSAQQITIKGELISASNITIPATTTILRLYDDVTLANNVSLTSGAALENVAILGNVELTTSGSGKLALTGNTSSTTTVTVYGNCTLTNNGTIEGDNSNKVTFVSTKDTSDTDNTPKTYTGKVVNNGTVNKSKDAYTNSRHPWWTGNAAVTE